MEIELIEIRDFLAERPPFDALTEEQLDLLPKQLEIRYLRRNSAFPPEGTTGNYLYILRSGAVELLDNDENLVEKLGEGGIYTTQCQLIDISRASQGVATEDTLLYVMSCKTLQNLRDTEPSFNEHFSESMRDRLKQAVKTLKVSNNNNPLEILTGEIKGLLQKAPVTADVESSIREIALVMSAKNISSMMLMKDEQLVGMITDRDLRKRCVAAGVSPD
ncbi:MAG: CBS domain-containing protein, partial [Candidatus Thiodiazotropha taylori]|nr:CBS domain-containing protein [Candidatus Thiodiazotropha endolucinida]MCW4230319.1 CBS domain-containing protein [Candidatus Thiodiazotropha taylori]